MSGLAGYRLCSCVDGAVREGGPGGAVIAVDDEGLGVESSGYVTRAVGEGDGEGLIEGREGGGGVREGLQVVGTGAYEGDALWFAYLGYVGGSVHLIGFKGGIAGG